MNYQFPWYQGLNVELINKAIFDKAGVNVADLPQDHRRPARPVRHHLDKAGNAVRHPPDRVSDLLAQMVYEGNVKVFSDDGKTFAFNSPEGVAWLQMYVDMVKAGTVDTTVLDRRRPRRPQRLLGRRGAVLRDRPEPGPPGQGQQRHPLRQPRHGPLAARQVRRGGQGPDVDLGQEGHQVPERVHRPRAVLHEPAEHGRVRQAGRHLPVVAGGV